MTKNTISDFSPTSVILKDGSLTLIILIDLGKLPDEHLILSGLEGIGQIRPESSFPIEGKPEPQHFSLRCEAYLEYIMKHFGEVADARWLSGVQT